MDREEAIKAFEEIKRNAETHIGKKYAIGCENYYKNKIELAEIALDALRSNEYQTRSNEGALRADHIGDTADMMDPAITDLLARAEAAEAANTQLDGTVSTLMESNKRLAEELKAHSDTEIAKAHEALSAEWARQKMRADDAEEKYAALLKEKLGENASTKMMEMVDTVNEMRQKLAEAEARAEKAERERDAAVKAMWDVL